MVSTNAKLQKRFWAIGLAVSLSELRLPFETNDPYVSLNNQLQHQTRLSPAQKVQTLQF